MNNIKTKLLLLYRDYIYHKRYSNCYETFTKEYFNLSDKQRSLFAKLEWHKDQSYAYECDRYFAYRWNNGNIREIKLT